MNAIGETAGEEPRRIVLSRRRLGEAPDGPGQAFRWGQYSPALRGREMRRKP
jgi:hypothetical protein